MRFLILNTDYATFIEQLYAGSPGLDQRPFADQMRVRMDTLFGAADYYSHALRQLGHEAIDIHANNPFAQEAWAREHGFAWTPREAHQRRVPWRCIPEYGQWILEILAAQIRHYRPDVLLNQAMDGIAPEFLREMRGEIGKIVGQHAAMPLPPKHDWGVYDLAVSSFPPTVDWFRARGIRGELNRLGFDPRVLNLAKAAGQARALPVTFIGSFLEVHSSRTAVLEFLAQHIPLKIWGTPPRNGFSSCSHLHDCYMGPAWGLDMFRILGRSQLTLNHHGNVPPFANNFRLFEATGMGAMLITDAKPNLGEMFVPGRDVAAYATAEECLDQVRYYLAHDQERQRIAEAGHARCLRDHTIMQRMRELVELLGTG